MLPLEPLFVNRARELAEFASVLEDTARGRPRHVALLGLRRIGKTVLLDEVRRRHPTSAIGYLALDEVVSTPEDFARAFLFEVLRSVRGAATSEELYLADEALLGMAEGLHPDLVPPTAEILRLVREGSYGALLVAVMRFPAVTSTTLDRPLLLMLDEFQEITRLGSYPAAENLLGTLRAALDRPGRVSFAVAGSRVTAMRNLLGGSENPLLTRFQQLELLPFDAVSTEELTTLIWDAGRLTYDPDAAVRLQKLVGGWPFYVQAIAAHTRKIAEGRDNRVTSDLVDLAFQREVFGRGANVGQNCRYLLEAATRTDAESLRNTLESALRAIARTEPVTRLGLVRRLARHHPHAQVHRAINRLIENDFVGEEDGTLTLLDPVFALWLTVEPTRRDPEAALDPKVVKRLVSWHEARHAADRQEIGALFEKRLENLVRQFKGQVVDGRLFGVEGDVRLPVVRDAGKVRVADPGGKYGDGPDTYEVDVVTSGLGPEDVWGVEAKHRRSAIAEAMVRRFKKNADAIARAKGQELARLWIVAPRGIRPDAAELARGAGILFSGMRQLDKLEAAVADQAKR